MLKLSHATMVLLDEENDDKAFYALKKNQMGKKSGCDFFIWDKDHPAEFLPFYPSGRLN